MGVRGYERPNNEMGLPGISTVNHLRNGPGIPLLAKGVILVKQAMYNGLLRPFSQEE